jgi:hypothetical protein
MGPTEIFPPEYLVRVVTIRFSIPLAGFENGSTIFLGVGAVSLVG